MTLRAESRRAVAKLHGGPGASAFPMCGGRPIYRYWSIVQPHLRSILLAPQWQSSDEDVCWNWIAPAEAPALTAEDLSAVRIRLRNALAALLAAPEGGRSGLEASERAAQISRNVTATLNEIITKLMAKSDA